MAGRYSREQLLYLKDSPLVAKPDSLPPPEEWMGPLPDPNQRKVGVPRARPDESNHLDPFSKRSSLFDTHHTTRKSTSAPEDLVLGPPKTTFSSSNVRTLGRSPQSKDTDEDTGRVGDRNSSYDKFRKNGDGEERDSEKRDTRFPTHSGRRGQREDREGWDLNRQRRHLDGEDRERRPRRNGGDRLDTREFKGMPGTGSDDRFGKADEGRLSTRHDGDRRARLQQSWFKGDQSRDGAEEGNTRSLHWRKDGGGGASKIDQNVPIEEPEWLDASDTSKQQQVHTQEDFQRWKEQMKAGAQPSDAETEERSQVEPPKKTESGSADNNFGTFGFDEATAPSIDSFFGMFTASSKTKEPTLGTGEGKEREKPNSRFKSLFSPSATVAEKSYDHAPRTASVELELERPVDSAQTAPVSESADQEGFQRILQMLGGRSRNTTPHETHQERSHSIAHLGTGPLAAGFSSQHADTIHNTAANEPRSRNSGGLESLLPPTSPGRASDPARKSGNSRDTEMLLRLMKQASINDSGPTQETFSQGSNSSEGPRYAPLQRNSQAADVPVTRVGRETSARFSTGFDEQVAVEAQPLQHEHEVSHQRADSRPQRTPFDEAILNRLAMNQPRNMGPGRRPPLSSTLPPDVARFSNVGGNSFMHQAPPGWSNQHVMQPPLPPNVPPSAPPGIPNPPNRGPNPSFPPMMQNMHQPQASPVERTPKYAGALGSSGPPYPGQGPPPGMGFLPGYMNSGNSSNMSPQGFPQTNRSPVDNHLFGGRGVSGGQGPMMPQSSGNLMDIFASGPDGRGGGRGGGGIPGGSLYR